MRNLVQPPPTLHCDLCHAELRLKQVEPTDESLDLDIQIWVCARCSREQTYAVSHNHYAAHATNKVRPVQGD